MTSAAALASVKSFARFVVTFPSLSGKRWAHVTAALDVAPAATVLLDDFAANVNGARAVGWQGILVGSDRAAAIAELDELLGSPEP